ncbi:hypothetical protein FIBSPDRAFT_1038824 [Athelia psychrophila]|uniref:Uncharacterized protein n=1 Tax=Athelia psychrophila TaxID=1759441 RepID=A0A166SGW4_9AGAM|nr:hypothetical protein FIBSPDRAFT_1038824 [Fibularhizoctonia sp. CBS 109695]
MLLFSTTLILPLEASLHSSAATAGMNRTTETGQASIHDPTAECTPYDYTRPDALTANFPPKWVQPVTLLSPDAAANALWNHIKRRSRRTSRRTVPCRAISAVCTTPKPAGLKPNITGVPELRVFGRDPPLPAPALRHVDHHIRSIAAALSLLTILWQHDSSIYNGPSVHDQNYENLTARAKHETFDAAEVIILTHEFTNFTVETAVTYTRSSKLRSSISSWLAWG